jgi:hypothetical protein
MWLSPPGSPFSSNPDFLNTERGTSRSVHDASKTFRGCHACVAERQYRSALMVHSSKFQTLRSVSALALVGLTFSTAAQAASFTAGNVVVYRVGDGAAALVNTGAAVFLDEYTPAGVLVQSVALPTATAGSNRTLIASGTATSEGFLTRSADKRFLVASGYDRALGTGTGSLVSTTAAAVNRVVGRIGADASIDTTTALNNWVDANNPRSAATVDGSSFFLAGASGGLSQAPHGGTTATQLSTASTVVNLRQVNVFDSTVYVSTNSGSSFRVAAFNGTDNLVNLTGLPTTGSFYGFFFADLSATEPGVDTLYVAADDVVALTKFSSVGGTWASNGVVGVDADDYRGLTATVSGNTVTLFATRKGGSAGPGGGELVSLVDASGHNGAFAGTPTLLATAASQTAFRGIAPAPEATTPPAPRVPALGFRGLSGLALGLAALVLGVARRRRA